jgi:hypothetical protein
MTDYFDNAADNPRSHSDTYRAEMLQTLLIELCGTPVAQLDRVMDSLSRDERDEVRLALQFLSEATTDRTDPAPGTA